MKKILLPILILPLIFFTGCDEEEEIVTESTDLVSYTIDDMVGTWNMVSNQIAGSASMDLSTLGDMYSDIFSEFNDFNGVWDEGEDFVDENGNWIWDDGEPFTDTSELKLMCELMQFTYDESTGCTIDTTMLTMLTAIACAEIEGTLSGTTCTMAIVDEECCGEGQSEIVIITSDGVMTLVGVDEDGQWTDSGTISVDGMAFTIEIDEECECFELDQTACGTYDTCEWSDYDGECSGDYEGDCLDTLSGILSINGNTATMTVEVDFEEFVEDFMDEDETDCNYSETEEMCDDCGGDWDAEDNYCYDDGDEGNFDLPTPTGSISQVIVLEKAAE